MTVKMDHYMEKLKELYPDMPEKSLRDIVRTGFVGMRVHLWHGKDIDFEIKKKGLKFLVYKYKHYMLQRSLNAQKEIGQYF